MKKSIFTLFILALITSAGFAQMSDMEKTIIAKEKAIYEAIKAGDMKTFSSALADDFVGVYSYGIFNRSQEIENIENLKIDSYELSDFKVMQAAEGVAVVAYKMKGSGSYMDQQFSGTYHCASTWVQSNGKWLTVMHTDMEAEDLMGNDDMDEDMEDDSDY